MAVLEAKTDNISDGSSFADEKPKANTRNNPAPDKKGSGTMQSHADLMVRAIKRRQSAQHAERQVD